MNGVEMTMSARARALVSLVGAAVLFGAVSLGPVATAVAGVIIGLILATGWAFLIELPNPGTARRVIVAVSVAANAVAYFFGVRELAFVAGFTVVVGFVAEMARRDGRPRLLEQISGTVAGSMLVVMGALWTRTLALDAGVTAARAVLIAVAVAIVLEILIPHSLRSLRHVVYMTGGFSGGLLFVLFSDIAWYAAPLAGLAAGSILAMFDSILRRLPPATRRRPGATLAMVPLCAAAVVAYTLALVIS